MLRDLHQTTGETVLMERQSGLFMQYVSMIESGHAARMSVSPGIIRPMHRSAIGIMLLSKMDDEDIGRLLRRYNAELTRDLSRLLQHGDESFEHFDLTLYDESARPKMERVFQVCRTFAQTFRPGTMNLLLQGGTGLGKTYLSACIARVVAGAGYAVAYETAASALDAFECAKFQRSSADGEAAAQRVEQYLGCNLMILDDLGTEMITAYSTSALYTLINTRLTRAKATIISTNCSNEELQKKYTPQILSRIEGEYQTLPFVGRDIRQIKKEREA